MRKKTPVPFVVARAEQHGLKHCGDERCPAARYFVVLMTAIGRRDVWFWLSNS